MVAVSSAAGAARIGVAIVIKAAIGRRPATDPTDGIFAPDDRLILAGDILFILEGVSFVGLAVKPHARQWQQWHIQG